MLQYIHYVYVYVLCVTGTGGLDKGDVVDSGKGSPPTTVDAVTPGTGSAVTQVNSWQTNGAIPSVTAYNAATCRPAWGSPTCPSSDGLYEDYWAEETVEYQLSKTLKTFSQTLEATPQLDRPTVCGIQTSVYILLLLFCLVPCSVLTTVSCLPLHL